MGKGHTAPAAAVKLYQLKLGELLRLVPPDADTARLTKIFRQWHKKSAVADENRYSPLQAGRVFSIKERSTAPGLSGPSEDQDAESTMALLADPGGERFPHRGTTA